MNNTTRYACKIADRAAATRAKFAAENAAMCRNNRSAIERILPILEGAVTTVGFEGQGPDERVVFTSPTTGGHALFINVTDGERFVGHLEGFLSGQSDTGGGWLKIRTLSRSERSSNSTCDACSACLDEYVVSTDFGVFCTLGCAIMQRDEYADNTDGDA